MSEQTWFVISIIAYLMTMLAIGYWSYTKAMALLSLNQPSDIFSVAVNNDYGTNGVVEA